MRDGSSSRRRSRRSTNCPRWGRGGCGRRRRDNCRLSQLVQIGAETQRRRSWGLNSVHFAIQSGLTLDDWHELVRRLTAVSTCTQRTDSTTVVAVSWWFETVAHRREETKIGCSRNGSRHSRWRRWRRIAVATVVRTKWIRSCRAAMIATQMMVMIVMMVLTGQAQSHDRWLETSKIRRFHYSTCSLLQHPQADDWQSESRFGTFFSNQLKLNSDCFFLFSKELKVFTKIKRG